MVEIIQAFAGLWPLALMVFLIISVLLYRNQLRPLLDELKQFSLRKGDAEMSLKREGRLASAMVDSVPAGEPVEQKAAGSGVKSRPIDDYMRAVFERSRSGVEAAYPHVQSDAKDDHERMNNEAMHYYILYSNFEDGKALKKLTELSERKEVDANGLRWLGMAYERAGDHARAVSVAEKAAKLSDDEEEKASFSSMASMNQYIGGRETEALGRLMQELGKVKATEARSILYEGLANIYKLKGDAILRAIALEKTLEGRPNNCEIRFAAAHGYGEWTLHRLALYHYAKYNEFRRDEPGVLNNTGVEYAALRLAGRSIQAYKESWDKGNTLAAANLAFAYMNAGFYPEARNILDRAKVAETVHPNVGSAIAALAQIEEREDEVAKQALVVAREHQRFFSAFGDAAFHSQRKGLEDPHSCFIGRWELPRRAAFDVTIVGGEIKAEWTIDTTLHYLTATISNTAFVGYIGCWDRFKISKTEKRILGYLVPEGVSVLTIGADDNDAELLVCRILEPEVKALQSDGGAKPLALE